MQQKKVSLRHLSSAYNFYRCRSDEVFTLTLVAKTIFYSLAALVRKILFCHSKIKFISSRHRVISSIYILFEHTINIIESFALSPGLIYIF